MIGSGCVRALGRRFGRPVSRPSPSQIWAAYPVKRNGARLCGDSGVFVCSALSLGAAALGLVSLLRQD